MRSSLTYAVVMLFGWLTPLLHADEPPPESSRSISIFNGKDLTGFDGDPRLWSVVDGAIRGETTEANSTRGNTFLIWKDGLLNDFILRFRFRCNATNNSGVQYRSRRIGTDVPNGWVVRGYQHEIRNQTNLPDISGFIYDEGGKRGRLCLVGEKVRWTQEGKQLDEIFLTQAQYETLFRLDDWNEAVIVANGAEVKHFLNGTLVLQFQDLHPELALSEGILAFQLHAGKPMWVEFKEIRLETTN